MRAYVVASGIRISPFGDLARDLPIGNEPLAAIQRRLFARFGLEVVDLARAEDVPAGEPCIVTYDHVYFTRRVLKSFLERWKKRGEDRPVQLTLPEASTFVRDFSDRQLLERKDGHACFDFYGLPRGGALDRAACEPLQVLYEERIVPIPVPATVAPDRIWPHPITSSVCFHVRHWLPLLQANRMAIQVRWVDHLLSRPLFFAWILAKALLPWPGRGRFIWRLLGGANRVARGADVHPTARLEGAFVERGAKIGAFCLVRGSIVGEGAVIEERSAVLNSVLGPNSFVSKSTTVYGSLVLEGASVAGGIQLALLGRGAAVTPRSTLIDMNPGGVIRVEDDGVLVEVGIKILGSCLGHGAFIGPDVYLAAGRSVPGGAKIGPTSDRILTAVPADSASGLAGQAQKG